MGWHDADSSHIPTPQDDDALGARLFQQLADKITDLLAEAKTENQRIKIQLRHYEDQWQKGCQDDPNATAGDLILIPFLRQLTYEWGERQLLARVIDSWQAGKEGVIW